MIDLTYEERIRREADNLRTNWSSSPRWAGIERPFEAEDVIRLRGSIMVEHTLARLGVFCAGSSGAAVPNEQDPAGHGHRRGGEDQQA